MRKRIVLRFAKKKTRRKFGRLTEAFEDLALGDEEVSGNARLESKAGHMYR